MKRSYYLFPTILLIIFSIAYVNYSHHYDERDRLAREQQLAENTRRIEAENETRRQAIEDALKIQVQRESARKAREKAEADALELRRLALESRDQARDEQQGLSRKLRLLEEELKQVEDAIGILQKDQLVAQAEKEHLHAFVEKAESNARSLNRLLEELVLTSH